MNSFEQIEKTHGFTMGDPSLDMMLVFNPETHRQAQELDAPGRLAIINPQDLPEDMRRGIGGQVGACLCIVIGKRDIVHSIQTDQDLI